MSSSARTIRKQPSRHSISRSPVANSYLSGCFLPGSPLAQESIARNLEECEDDDDDVETPETGNTSLEDAASETSTVRPDAVRHSMASSYHPPSHLTKKETKPARDAERSLLRDNHRAPPKHPQARNRRALSRLHTLLFSAKRPKPAGDAEADPADPASAGGPSESSALLGDGVPESARSRHERLNAEWEAAVASGQIKTTWQREAKTLWAYSSPLVVTFVLQYSLPVASIFTIGHLGKVELGAVSLASMTANISGYAVYQGLATSLDTLCAQAYGSGKKHLVGLQLQRMVYFLWILTIPIGVLWWFADKLLAKVIPEQEAVELAGLYLRILLFGAPGYACFESGKRFVQAQGLFSATTYVLLVAAPLNAFMNWLFVWHFSWGFVGAPIAVAITDNLLPILLFLYVRYVDGRQCWNGFTWKAFRNWLPMIKLALPGLLMLEAEYLAFEILTFAASYFGTTHLAAQSVLSTVTAMTFQIPYSTSIAASTRVANLIGAALSDAAKTSAIVVMITAALIGVFNVILLSSLRDVIPQLFTSDQDVSDLATRAMPLCAAFQLFDALAANCNGLLRGLGKQEIGGWVNLFFYYAMAMPISFYTAFALDWELEGLWSGVALALVLVAAAEGYFIWKADWNQAVEDAQVRNDAG